MLKLFFENSNFRNFFVFRTFRGIGSGIFAIFMMWVVHFQYQTPFYTGMAGFMFALPFVMSFIAGPFVDKRNKIIIMRMACLAKLLVISLLLVVSSVFNTGVWFILLVILVYQTALMIDSPAETAFLPTIVNSEDLIKANAFINIVSIILGLGAGVFLYFTLAGGAGFEIVYAVNAAVIFIALIFSVFLHSTEPIKPERNIDKTTSKKYFRELKEGFSFVKRGVILFLFLALVFQEIFAGIAYVNLPMFAQIHTGQASGYIILSALAGIGGILGSYISRIFGSKFEVWKIIVICFIAAGVTRIIFVNVMASYFSRAIWVYILYVGLGSTIGIFFNTLFQKLPPKHLIARVNTINTSLLSIIGALGALIGGLMGTFFKNVDTVFIIHGVSYIIIGLCLLFSKRIRALPKISNITSIE